MLSDSAILKKIEQQSKRTAGFKQLARELGVHGDARRELFERLKHLVAGGQLQQVGPDRYAIPQAAAGKNMAVGRLSMHRDGFGFVIPEADSLDERLKAGWPEIFSFRLPPWDRPCTATACWWKSAISVLMAAPRAASCAWSDGRTRLWWGNFTTAAGAITSLRSIRRSRRKL